MRKEALLKGIHQTMTTILILRQEASTGDVVVVIVIVIEVIILIAEKREGVLTEIITNTNIRIVETTTTSLISHDMKSKNFRMMMLKIM